MNARPRILGALTAAALALPALPALADTQVIEITTPARTDVYYAPPSTYYNTPSPVYYYSPPTTTYYTTTEYVAPVRAKRLSMSSNLSTRVTASVNAGTRGNRPTISGANASLTRATVTWA